MNSSSTEMDPEIRKMTYSNLPEGRSHEFDINSPEDAFLFEQNRRLAINYFNSKKQHWNTSFENQFEVTTKEFEEMEK